MTEELWVMWSQGPRRLDHPTAPVEYRTQLAAGTNIVQGASVMCNEVETVAPCPCV
ncbi:hypothetical protein GQ44DRAFT_719934 [Phaeosphaeriaceae sp. PMI808]|nr:hypothetical protein GQ44DRAFT_719934 [Phaeosphaeriaceae sp. PMI808]